MPEVLFPLCISGVRVRECCAVFADFWEGLRVNTLNTLDKKEEFFEVFFMLNSPG